MTKKTSFIRLKNLLIKTGNEWKDIADENTDGTEVINKFTLPLLSLCTFSTFIGSLFNREGFDFATALKVALAAFLSFYGAIYLALLLINFIKPMFHVSVDKSKTLTFIGYNYGLFLVIESLTGLFPEFYLIQIVILYTIFIIWEGVIPIFKVREEQRTGFALICSVIILAAPFVLSKLFYMLIPGINIG